MDTSQFDLDKAIIYILARHVHRLGIEIINYLPITDDDLQFWERNLKAPIHDARSFSALIITWAVISAVLGTVPICTIKNPCMRDVAYGLLCFIGSRGAFFDDDIFHDEEAARHHGINMDALHKLGSRISLFTCYSHGILF